MAQLDSRLFAGWWVVAGAFLVMFFAYCMQFGYGVFLPYMVEELQWTRADVATPFAIYLLTYSGLSYFSGRLTDHFGPRPVIVCGGILMGIGYFSIGHITERWHLMLVFGLIAGVGMSVVFVPCHATVVKWFERRRTLALGIMGTGMNLANLSGPFLASVLIVYFGWRNAIEHLALGGAVLIALSAFLLHRDPETRGLSPDGASVSKATASSQALQSPAITLREALRYRVLWCILGIYSFSWLVLFFPYVHLPQHGLDLRLSGSAAAGLLSCVGAGGIVGRVWVGWLADRFGARPALQGCLLAQVLALSALSVAEGLVLPSMAALLYGLGTGGGVSLFAAIVGDCFGRRHAGSIVGFLFALASGLAALGPYVSGLMRDSLGSYSAAFFVAACMNLLALLLSCFLQTGRVRAHTD